MTKLLRFAIGALLLIVSSVCLLIAAFTRRLPDERIATGNIGAVLKHRESCWSGCSSSTDGMLTYRGRDAEPLLFPDAMQLRETLFVSQAMVFPNKRMVVAALSTNNFGNIVAGMTDHGGAPRLNVLAGSLRTGSGTLRRPGASAKPSWTMLDYRFGYPSGPARFVADRHFSYHENFWVDYAAEEVWPIGPDPEGIADIDPIGPTQDRQAFLVLYRSSEPANQYMLCSATGPDGTGHCAVFTADDGPSAPSDAPMPAAPVPVPAVGIAFVDAGGRTAQCRTWLASRFDLEKVGPTGELILLPGNAAAAVRQHPHPESGSHNKPAPAAAEGDNRRTGYREG